MSEVKISSRVYVRERRATKTVAEAIRDEESLQMIRDRAGSWEALDKKTVELRRKLSREQHLRALRRVRE